MTLDQIFKLAVNSLVGLTKFDVFTVTNHIVYEAVEREGLTGTGIREYIEHEAKRNGLDIAWDANHIKLSLPPHHYTNGRTHPD